MDRDAGELTDLDVRRAGERLCFVDARECLVPAPEQLQVENRLDEHHAFEEPVADEPRVLEPSLAQLIRILEAIGCGDRLRKVAVRTERRELEVVPERKLESCLQQRASLVVPVSDHEEDAPAAQRVRKRLRQPE
jgi:hypothetical protein